MGPARRRLLLSRRQRRSRQWRQPVQKHHARSLRHPVRTTHRRRDGTLWRTKKRRRRIRSSLVSRRSFRIWIRNSRKKKSDGAILSQRSAVETDCLYFRYFDIRPHLNTRSRQTSMCEDLPAELKAQEPETNTPQSIPAFTNPDSHNLLKEKGAFLVLNLLTTLFRRIYPTALPQVPRELSERAYRSRRGWVERNEDSLPLLELLPSRQLQQRHVWRVQTQRLKRCKRSNHAACSVSRIHSRG